MMSERHVTGEPEVVPVRILHAPGCFSAEGEGGGESILSATWVHMHPECRRKCSGLMVYIYFSSFPFSRSFHLNIIQIWKKS